MNKNKCLIFIIFVILIIVSFNNVVYAAKWKWNDDETEYTYLEAYETYYDAVDAALTEWLGWSNLLNQIGKDGIDDELKAKINEQGDDMQIGDTKIFTFVDAKNKAQTEIMVPGPMTCKISITRQENTKKGFFNKKEVKQYKPTLIVVSEDASIGSSEYYMPYRDYIKNIVNSDLGTNIPLPEEGVELQDGEEVYFERKWSSRERKYYNITIKAEEKTLYGTTYIVYTYDHEEDTSNNINTGITQTITQDNSKNNSQEDFLEDLDAFKPGNIGEEEGLVKKAGVIIGVINAIGVIICIITLMIIGFKYMIGSVEEKANYKKTMMPWLIGAVILFTATTIPNLMYNITTSLFNEASTAAIARINIEYMDI